MTDKMEEINHVKKQTRAGAKFGKLDTCKRQGSGKWKG